jgi:hypothetical protein
MKRAKDEDSEFKVIVGLMVIERIKLSGLSVIVL